ncbi:MAG: hypothetical protein NTX03_12650 [Bacteroidetes bacterium]|nr:hypothetical protein [Bacteroidota bacterium]
MKNHLLFSLGISFFMLISFNAKSQDSIKPKPRKPYGQFYIMGGVRSVMNPASNVSLMFIDESANPDTVNNSKTLKSGKYAPDILFGMVFPIKNYWFIKGQLGVFVLRNYGFNLDLGGGINLETPHWIIQPGIDFSMNSSAMPMGSMVRKSDYIQINDKQFTDKSISITADDFYMGVQPNIGFQYTLNRNVNIRGDIGYHYNFYKNTDISFSGITANNTDESTNKKLSAANVEYRINNSISPKSPFDYNGLFVHFGVAWNLFNGEKSTNTNHTSQPNNTNNTNPYTPPVTKPKVVLPREEIPKPKPKQKVGQ